jgi:hypothetical protein
MMQIALIRIFVMGLGAGAVTALLIASGLSGAAPAMLLPLLAPLPILIVARGWSRWARADRDRHGGEPIVSLHQMNEFNRMHEGETDGSYLA